MHWGSATNNRHQKQTVYALNILFPLCNGLIKLSLLALFRRVFRPLSQVTTSVLILFTTIVVLWTLGFTIASIFSCLPIADFFQPQLPAESQCLSSAFYDTLAVTDLVTAIMVLALPIPSALNTGMPMRMRLATSLLFLLGVFAVVAGAIRLCYYLIQGSSALEGPNSSFYTPPLEYWSIIETSVGIWCACFPTFGAFFNHPAATDSLPNDDENPHNTPVGRPRDGTRAGSSTTMRESDNTGSDKTRETSYASGNSVVWPLPPSSNPTSPASNSLLSPSKLWPRDALVAAKPVPPPKSNMGATRLPSTLKSHPPIEETPEPPSEHHSRTNSDAQAAEGSANVVHARRTSGRRSRSHSGSKAVPEYRDVDLSAGKGHARSASSATYHSRSNPQSASNSAAPSRSNSDTRAVAAADAMTAKPTSTPAGHDRSNSAEKIVSDSPPAAEPYPVPAPLPPSASNVPPRKSSMRKPTVVQTPRGPAYHQPQSSDPSAYKSGPSLKEDDRARRRTGIMEVPHGSPSEGPILRIDGHEVPVMRDSRGEGLGTFYAHDDASSEEELERGRER